MPKRTKICFNVCQIIWNFKKMPKKISPNLGHSRGGGGQDGKWSDFPPFFLKLFPKCHMSHERGTRYCWAGGKNSFETNKWSMFLKTEATFPYCNCSIKLARSIGFGSTSVVNRWQRLGCLPFWVYVKVGYSFKKTYTLVSIKKKYLQKKILKRLPQV